VAANKRYSKGLRAGLLHAGALGRRLERDQLAGFRQQRPVRLDWHDREFDRGPSAFNVTHNLTFNWTWDIPSGSVTGVRALLLKGWQVNNTTTLMSGTPFTVRLGFNRSGNLNTTNFSLNERPNLKPGCDPILGGPDRYWDISCFELPAVNTRGNLGRNSLTGPGLMTADVAVVKTFAAGSAHAAGAHRRLQRVQPREFRRPSGRIAFTGVDARQPDRRADVGPHHFDISARNRRSGWTPAPMVSATAIPKASTTPATQSHAKRSPVLA
jgi:hypothetical protein